MVYKDKNGRILYVGATVIVQYDSYVANEVISRMKNGYVFTKKTPGSRARAQRPRNIELFLPTPPIEKVFVPVCELGQSTPKREEVNHPSHYGGADNLYEAIKVIEAWGLGFCLGNAVKYICRAGKKEGATSLTDLRKALWYLQRETENQEKANGL